MLFTLKKLISLILLPPGIFVAILIASGFHFWRKRKGAPALVVILMGLALWVMSSPPVAGTLMRSLEKGLSIPKPLRGDVIILLGGGINEGVPDLTGTNTPSDDMMGRVVTAVRAQRQLKVPIIVSGGVVFAGHVAEAPVVRRFLLDLGVPDNMVLLEARSRDTMENGRYTKEIIDRHGLRQPLLVTSAYHMRRSMEAFRRAGITATPLPAQFCTGAKLPPITTDYLPSAGAFNASTKALREYLGLLFYRLSK
jgi:uncharacterized SAM-binding protein YcdF (DUF218 family)